METLKRGRIELGSELACVTISLDLPDPITPWAAALSIGCVGRVPDLYHAAWGPSTRGPTKAVNPLLNVSTPDFFRGGFLVSFLEVASSLSHYLWEIFCPFFSRELMVTVNLRIYAGSLTSRLHTSATFCSRDQHCTPIYTTRSPIIDFLLLC
jgi:hypothetical protein